VGSALVTRLSVMVGRAERKCKLTLLDEVVELLEESGNMDDDTVTDEGSAVGVDET
jgi:hypothetical protein